MTPSNSIKLGTFVGIFRKYSAHIVFIFSIGILSATFLLNLRPFIGVSIGIFLGSACSVLLKTDFDFAQYTASPIDWRIGWMLTALYVTATIIAFRPVSRTRPIAQYLLFGLMAGALAFQIHRGQDRRHVLPQVLVFAFITYWSTQFAFPAGINGPDTKAFIPAAREIALSSRVPEEVVYGNTPNHMIYVAETSLITGEPIQLSYYLGSVITLVVTIAFVAGLSRVIPGFDDRTILFAALVFSITSFTLQRGFFPTKLNFFKPLILISIYGVYRSSVSQSVGQRFVPVTLIAVTALMFGHTYSMGIATIVVGSISGFSAFVNNVSELDYRERVPSGSTVRIALVFVLVLLGYSLIGNSGIIGRLQGILLSIIAPLSDAASSGSSGGRYASLPLGTLLTSTFSQTILFILGVVGSISLVQSRNWGSDSLLAWMVTGFALIGFSLIFNAVDIPTPRIYTLLVMFGLNIAVVLGIYVFVRAAPSGVKPVFAATIIAIFAIFSLVSPVAGMTLSPIGDDIPHFRHFSTHQEVESQEWKQDFLHLDGYPNTQVQPEVPLKIDDQHSVPEQRDRHLVIDRSKIEPGTIYLYNDLAAQIGTVSETKSTGLGGRIFSFVELPSSSELDNQIYENGEQRAFISK